jgi:GntR family transcriptional regulator
MLDQFQPRTMPDTAALPLYLRIAETLIRDIRAGRLAEGARLPPERDMARDLGVSVGTLRHALDELQAKGLLTRIQGSGNYIRSAPSPDHIYAFFRLERVEGGGLPTAQLLSLDRLPKPEGAPAFGAAPDGWRIRRLRHLGPDPAAIEEIWLDTARAPALAAEDLSESLYLTYRQRLHLTIARAEDRVAVAPVPDWAPPAFAPAPGSLAGFIERRAWGEGGQPAEYSRTWFDAAVARYVARLT